MRRFNIWTCMDVVGRSCQCDPAPDSPGHLRHCNLVSQHQQQITVTIFSHLLWPELDRWQDWGQDCAGLHTNPRLVTGAPHQISGCYLCYRDTRRWPGPRHRGSGAGVSVDTWSQLITNTATMESWPIITTTLYRGYDWIQHFTLSHLIISGSYCPRPKPSEPE